MHMVRHDDPSQKPVAFRIEVKQGVLDHGCNLWLFQYAAAMTGVNPLFDTVPTLKIPLRCGHKTQRDLDIFKYRFRQTVRQMNRYMLGGIFPVEVRKVPAAVPLPVPVHVPLSQLPADALMWPDA